MQAVGSVRGARTPACRAHTHVGACAEIQAMGEPASHLRLPPMGAAAARLPSEEHGAPRRGNDIEIEFVRSKKGLRQKQRVKQILEKRGEPESGRRQVPAR